jgi:hypothetical protein
MVQNSTISAVRLTLSALGIGLAAILSSTTIGCETEEALETLCEPGTNIFCRCEDGSAGTKKCKDDGQSAGACGNCSAPPVQNQPPALPPDPNVTHEQTLADFLAPCSIGSDCASSTCVSGYCTRKCDKVSECDYPASECVGFEGQTVCMPRCNAAADCSKYGAASQCGYATALDNWRVTACGNWAGQHQLKPVGSDCLPLDHKACNLGYTGRQTVCTNEGVCQSGCYYDSDCPGSAKCSVQGALGTCQ